ncbi:precorrin-2 dehydrogenase [Abditibacteriota bacterium]|nr:precorrin-2 dehydrogenase [Abditibacteriota bacterium]
MKVLPIALALENRCVLVVGGGPVAARKVAALLEAGALVTVISPELAPNFPAPIEYQKRRFETGDCQGFSFVFAATNAREVNRTVAADARQHQALINDASDPENSDFHTQAIVRRGPLSISLSTEGESPVVSAHLRREIEALIGPEWEELFDLMHETNAATSHKGGRGALWKLVLSGPILDLLREGKRSQAKAELESHLDH